MRSALLLILFLALSAAEALPVTGPHPRAFFFRTAESKAAGAASYDAWSTEFARLPGILGKMVDEEVPFRSLQVGPFFRRYQDNHPNHLVVCHFNGKACSPAFAAGRFFAGHWLHYNGTIVTSAVSAVSGESVLSVSNPAVFRLDTGLDANEPDDVTFCALDGQGRPDWSRAEQCKLVAVDADAGTVTVRRAQLGSTPLAFAAGTSWLAAHMAAGPYGSGADRRLLWRYNFSPDCPRDALGRTCTEVLISWLSELHAAGGPLAGITGMEFDVLVEEAGGGPRGADTDGDGRRDSGWFGSTGRKVNRYGQGVMDFISRLRAALGPSRLLLADGGTDDSQRAFGLLNGIECEGWPDIFDTAIDTWSSGINRVTYWAANGAKPSCNYVVFKFVSQTGIDNNVSIVPVPPSTGRLVMGAAVCMDAAVTWVNEPPPESGRKGIWDELRGGVLKQSGWLGQALGPARLLALDSPDLLAESGTPAVGLLPRTVGVAGSVCHADGDALRLDAGDTQAEWIEMAITGLPVDGPDLTVALTLHAGATDRVPGAAHRKVFVSAAGTGQRFQSFAGPEAFTTVAYFRDLAGPTMDLRLEIESGAAPLWITGLSIHAAPDARLRAFEHGAVLVNPATHPLTVDLASLLPGRRFMRLQSVVGQDTVTNDGSAITGLVTLGDRDGLFVRVADWLPEVAAGPDRTTYPGLVLDLRGIIADRDGPPVATWTVVGGPGGTPTFADLHDPRTTVVFPTAGSWILRLTAVEGGASSSDDCIVTVKPPPTRAIRLHLGDSTGFQFLRNGQPAGIAQPGGWTWFGANRNIDTVLSWWTAPDSDG